MLRVVVIVALYDGEAEKVGVADLDEVTVCVWAVTARMLPSPIVTATIAATSHPQARADAGSRPILIVGLLL